MISSVGFRSTTNPSMRLDSLFEKAPSQSSMVLKNRREVLSTISVLSISPILQFPQQSIAYTPDPDRVQESLYLISRVQEATVQQERFVKNSKLQEELQGKMKLTLKLVEKNYRLLDQINFCSAFVEPQSEVVAASQAGYNAAESLQAAIDFVRDDLKKGPLTDYQKGFLSSALAETRENLFLFLDYMPQDKLKNARLRIEDENMKNRDEFDGDSDAGVYNPVVLPWKQPRK